MTQTEGEPEPDDERRRRDDRRRTIDLTYLERGGVERRELPGVERRTARADDVPPAERTDDEGEAEETEPPGTP
ncbi:hypothetical protein [Angustibacter aerolatus]